MGLFDNLLAPFTGAPQQQASADQQAALQRAQQQGSAALGQGRSDIQGTYAAGLQPLQATYGGATQGTDQLARLLGLSGNPADMQSALEQTPGYQFTRDQGLQDTLRQSAAQGFGAGPGGLSGNTLKALTDYGSGLASQTYQNAVQNLMPYLQQRGATAGQLGGLAGQEAGQLAGNQSQLASLLYGTNVGQGNAQASADLAPLTAGANIWGLGGNLAKLGVSGGGAGGGTLGGNLASGLFGNIFNPQQASTATGLGQ